MRNVTTLAASALAVLATASLGSETAEARMLEVQTSSNASHFSLQYLRENWLPVLAERTGGELEINLLPIEAVVPRRETPEAIGRGILDGDLTAVSYFSGVDPAYALIGDLIAGYDTPEQITEFCRDGGGADMLQKLHDAHFEGVKVVGCGTYNREALVSTVPINGVADLEGKKIRAPEGLASDVFRRAGASPVNLPGSETYGALERGVIDAADNSAYSNNDANGMHDIAKYPLYPGIHSMPVLQFTVSQEAWEEMGEENQSILTDWYYEAYADLTDATRQMDEELVERDKAGGEITVIDWPQAERDKLRVIAVDAWKDFAAGSDLAQQAFQTHIDFMNEKGLLEGVDLGE